jgi:sulfur carrier protein ThiS
MKVMIDNQEIEIFTGAKVKNALSKYAQKEYKAVQAGEKKIVDKNGNPVDLNGALSEGSKLFVKNSA